MHMGKMLILRRLSLSRVHIYDIYPPLPQSMKRLSILYGHGILLDT